MTCGREAVTANYLKNYPDKAAMGDLAFSELEILPAGADHAWCTGQWKIVRADTVGGGFSLLWLRTPQGWRILRDHSY
jgi:ketosteroid isomerase-like protein